MMKSTKWLFGMLLLLDAMAAQAQAPTLHRVHANNLKELQAYFSPQKDKPVIISGHRGGMLSGYPENSIEACEKTLTMLPSFFEIDPRLTKDSVLVLMHDKTLDRTTTGSGSVSDYTYAELQQFFLKDREGNVTPYKIPTLLQMLEWGKDKTIFNLDNKEVPWHMYVSLLNKHRFPNIILSVRSLREALYYYERNKEVMLCVAIFNQKDYDAYAASGIPWNRIMAYVGYTMDPQQKEVYDLLRKHGVMCMVSIHPTKDRAKTLEEKKAGYREELAKKPDIIETDYPALFHDLTLTK